MWYMWFPTFGFWWVVLSVLAFSWIAIAAENERCGHVALAMFTWLLLTSVFGSTLYVFAWIFTHPFHLVILAVSYFGAGLGWGTFRWWWDQSKVRRRYDALREEWFHEMRLVGNGQSYTKSMSIPDSKLEDWQHTLDRRYECNPRHYTFSKKRSEIAWRMTLWPFSMTGFLLTDFVKQVYDMALDKLSDLYERISKSIWKDVLVDFRPPETPDADLSGEHGNPNR